MGVLCVNRDLVEYEKKRAEERANAAEGWRQKESARAKQVEAGMHVPCMPRP
jgi:hypothetical protein